MIYQDVGVYREALAEMRESFFCRTRPWAMEPTPTRIEIVISLAAHNGVFQKVEPGLAHLLATGEIENGAAQFNLKAGYLDQ